VDIDLLTLRYFATVAELLHFGRAAAALNVARPVLSRAVTDLEAELGTELFVRPSEHTELTDAGRALLERARVALAEHDDAAEAADDAADVARAELTHRRAERDAARVVGGDAAGGAGEGSRSRTFTVAIVPGVTISKWTTVWAQRRPDVPLRVLRADESTQVALLHEGSADVSFVRLPVDRTGLSTIPLYAEVPVVVLPKDHELTLLDSVSVADLVEEHLLQDPDSVPEWRDAALTLRTGPRRALPAMESTADAIALVAAGVGIVIVPQSVARLNHRKDVTYRTVVDVAPHGVGLAWLAESSSLDVEEFIGIVRGRSARSSRSAQPGEQAGAPAQAASAAGAQPRARARDQKAAGPRTSSGNRKRSGASKARRPRGSR